MEQKDEITCIVVSHRAGLRNRERKRPQNFGKIKTFNSLAAGKPGSNARAIFTQELGRNGMMILADYEAGNYMPYGFDDATIQLIEDAKGNQGEVSILNQELAKKDEIIAKMAEELAAAKSKNKPDAAKNAGEKVEAETTEKTNKKKVSSAAAADVEGEVDSLDVLFDGKTEKTQ